MAELKTTVHRFIDMNGIEGIEEYSCPRVFATHIRAQAIPWSAGAKYVYMIRDPRDVIISYKSMIFKLHQIPDAELSKLIDKFIQGSFRYYNNYFDHVRDWYNKYQEQVSAHERGIGEEPNILVIFYEQLLTDPKSHVIKLAKFLYDGPNGHFSNLLDIETNEVLIEKVISKTSFEKLKSNHDSNLTEGTKMFSGFFRKGIKGDYKNHFTRDQDVAVQKLIRDKLGEPFTTTFGVENILD